MTATILRGHDADVVESLFTTLFEESLVHMGGRPGVDIAGAILASDVALVVA